MSYDVTADRARWTDGENTACLTLLDGLDDDLVGRSLLCRAISDTGAIYNLFYNYSSLNRPYKQITHDKSLAPVCDVLCPIHTARQTRQDSPVSVVSGVTV